MGVPIAPAAHEPPPAPVEQFDPLDPHDLSQYDDVVQESGPTRVRSRKEIERARRKMTSGAQEAPSTAGLGEGPGAAYRSGPPGGDERISVHGAVGNVPASVDELAREIKRGARFVQYHCVVSLFIVSFKFTSSVYYFRTPAPRFAMGWAFALLTALVGLWGIPFGLIWSIAAIIRDLCGGEDVTFEVKSTIFHGMAKEEVAYHRQFNA